MRPFAHSCLVVLLLVGCGMPQAVQPPMRACDVTVRVASDEPALAVRGEWSGFAREPLTQEAPGAFSWRSTLDFRSVGYAYRLELPDGGLILDPGQIETRWVGTVEQSRLRVPDCTLPALEAQAWSADGQGQFSVTFRTFRNAKGTPLNAPRATLDGVSVELPWASTTGQGHLEGQGLTAGKHTLRLSLADQSGAEAESLDLPFWVEARPFQFEGALMYFVFTDRFRNGSAANDAPVPAVDAKANYQGGDWAGVAQAIDEGYFDRLGVQVIWLSPPEANPSQGFVGTDGRQYSGYHGYWPMSPRQPQSRFGSLADLKALVAAAHAHGIRVITDLVLNHVHEQHPWYAQHRDDDWFNTSQACVCGAPGCDWDSNALTCWFTAYLPDLNWKNTQMADAFTADVRWWLREADVDGFRLDAVKHLERTGTRAIRATMNRYTAITGVPSYLVGETFTSVDGRPLIRSYLGPQLLDGQFDFPLYWVVTDVFARGQSFRQLDTAMMLNTSAYPASAINSAFLGNHDVARFISVANGDIGNDALSQAWLNPPGPTVDADAPFLKARLAFAFLLTQPGVPLIYYGDEVGLPGAGDPDNRRMMKWAGLSARESALLSFLQTLGSARRDAESLHSGERKTLWVDDDLLVMQRVSGAHSALVVINRGAAKQITVTPAFSPGSHTVKDIFTGQTLQISGPTTLSVPAATVQVFID